MIALLYSIRCPSSLQCSPPPCVPLHPHLAGAPSKSKCGCGALSIVTPFPLFFHLYTSSLLPFPIFSLHERQGAPAAPPPSFLLSSPPPVPFSCPLLLSSFPSLIQARCEHAQLRCAMSIPSPSSFPLFFPSHRLFALLLLSFSIILAQPSQLVSLTGNRGGANFILDHLTAVLSRNPTEAVISVHIYQICDAGVIAGDSATQDVFKHLTEISLGKCNTLRFTSRCKPSGSDSMALTTQRTLLQKGSLVNLLQKTGMKRVLQRGLGVFSFDNASRTTVTFAERSFIACNMTW